MRATGDEAAKKFEHFVKLAKGDAYLVYLALATKENATDEDIEKYIEEHAPARAAA